MIHGYARVSTKDQATTLQIDALRRAGVDEIHEETGSGVKVRPVLAALLARLVDGDVLAVWRLDRLGRSSRDVILTIDDLRQRGIVVRSLTEGLDTSTPTGRAFAGFLAVLAELERETLLERVRAGIASARADGRHGRPRTWSPDQIRHAHVLIAEGLSVRAVSRRVGLPRSTLVDALRRLPPAPPF